MKSSKAEAVAHRESIPELRFEDQQLTSFSGLVVVQALIARLSLLRRLRQAFGNRAKGRIFALHLIFLWWIVHLFIGYRRLRDRDFYCDDPMVQRALGLNRLARCRYELAIAPLGGWRVCRARSNACARSRPRAHRGGNDGPNTRRL